MLGGRIILNESQIVETLDNISLNDSRQELNSSSAYHADHVNLQFREVKI